MRYFTPSSLPVALLAVLSFFRPNVAMGQTALPIDVPAVQIQGDFLLNGAPAPPFTTESARLRLDGRLGLGSGFPIGRTYEQSYGPLWVIPTDYQPGYAFDFSVLGTALPANRQVPIGPFGHLDGSQPFDVDIPSVGVTVDVTLNDEPFAPGPLSLNDSEFLLRHVESGGEFVLGSTLDQPLFAWIVPGTYDLVYRHVSGLHPANTNATIAAGLDLSSTQTVAFDLEAYGHQQVVRLNGAFFPASPTNFGDIALESPDGRDRVELGPTFEPLPLVYLLAGQYSLIYERRVGGVTVPLNSRAVVDAAVVVEEPPPLEPSRDSTDIPMSVVSFEPTLNGSAFVASPTNNADWVVEDANGNETPVGDTLAPIFLVNLIHGTYDTYYRWNQGPLVPNNPDALVDAGRVVLGATTVAFDVPMVQISVEPLLNGAPWSPSPTDFGDLYLQGDEPADRFLLGQTLEALVFLLNVIPGRYEVIYDVQVAGFTAPSNQDERVASFDTAQGTAITFDVPVTTVTPTVSLNGQPFPTGGTDEARLVLRSWSGGETVLGTTDALPFGPQKVIDGAYRVDYEWRAGDAIPRNSWEPIGGTYVPEPGLPIGLFFGVAVVIAIRRGRVAPVRASPPVAPSR